MDGGPYMSEERKGNRAGGQIGLLGTASTMGLHMVSGPIVGGGLGWLVDKWLDSWPVGAGIGLLLGLAAGFRNVWIDARYLARSNAERDAEEKARREAERKEQEKRLMPAAPDPARTALVADTPESLAAEEARAEKKDAMTASILAGTADPSERDLEELGESLEAIRRELREYAEEDRKQDNHEHN